MNKWFFSICAVFFLSLVLALSGCSSIKNAISLTDINGSNINSPVIKSLIGTPASMVVNSISVLTCDATNQSGSPLSYTWSCYHGVLSATSGSSVSWTAPAISGIYTINVNVSDGKTSTNSSLNIIVVASSTGTIPAEPSKIYFSATTDSTTLISWDAVSGTTDYTISYGTDANASNIGVFTTTANAYNLTGLQSNTKYYLKVSAENSAGSSSYSAVEDFTTTAAAISAPEIPANLSSSAVAETSATLSWESVARASSYIISYGTDTNANNLGTVTASGNTYSFSGLTANTTYYAKVRASNLAGNSSYSTIISFTTSAATISLPLIPTGLTISGITQALATLTWESATGASSYIISYGTDTSANNLGTVTASGNTYSFSGLTANTTYYVKVRASNLAGNSSYSSIMSFTTSAVIVSIPSVPTGLAVSDIHSTNASVSWNSSSGATGYTISYGTDTNASSLGTINVGNNTSYSLTGLSLHTKYYVKLFASNSGGDSSYCVPLYFTTDVTVSTFVSGQDCGDIIMDSSGNFFAVSGNTVIKITSSGSVSIFAGSSTSGYINATGTNARFAQAIGMAIDESDNLYVADLWNNAIRKITPAGVVTSLLPPGSANNPYDVDYHSGYVYVAELAGQKISKINASTGAYSVLSNLGHQTTGLVVDSIGNVYSCAHDSYIIEKITPSGSVSTFVGSGLTGSANGTGTAASFNRPGNIAIDSSGNLYVSDNYNCLIRKITPSGIVTTLAGIVSAGAFLDGKGLDAKFWNPAGITFDLAGNLFVCDTLNSKIRKIVF